MEMRNRNRGNKEVCPKQTVKKVLLSSGSMGLSWNVKKSSERVGSLKQQKGNPEVKQKRKQMKGIDKGSCERSQKSGNILRLCRSTSSKIKTRYINESILTKSSFAKKPSIELTNKGMTPDSSHKRLSHKRSHQKLTKKSQMISKNIPINNTQIKKQRKFTDICITETKSKGKLIKRFLMTDWFKPIDQGKPEIKLQNQQEVCIWKSIKYEDSQSNHQKSKNQTKIGSQSTLITDQTSQTNSQNSSACNSRVVEDAHLKKRFLKFNVNLQGLKNKQILDYADEFMSHYDELSESWQRDITLQKRY